MNHQLLSQVAFEHQDLHPVPANQPPEPRVHYTYRPSSGYAYGPVPRDDRGWSNGGGASNQWLGLSETGFPASLLQRVAAFARRYVRTISSMISGSSSGSSLSSFGFSASTWRFFFLCCLWYSTSAMASNTAKPLLSLYRYPVTLTFLQFGFVAAYCLVCFSPLWKWSTIRMPTRAILTSTVPMALFQVGGHIFSSMAISRVPVSTVHTIKALSPLFTVGAYALLFGVTYSPSTYMSLIPLTIGVMLACTFDMATSNAFGLLCAFASALVVVSSNIFFKKVMPSKPSSGSLHNGPSHKLDKLNLLFYTSGLAFLFMIPLWLYSDISRLWMDVTTPNPSLPSNRPSLALYYLFLNVTVHFAQNLIAFAILSITSPVTYSIASLVKRIAVICMAILWFNQSVHPIQAVGIALAGVGLWMYNKAKADVEKGEKAAQRISAARDLQLPLSREELKSEDEGGIEQMREYSTSTSARPQGAPLTARMPPPTFGKPPPISIPSYGHTHTLSPADNYPSPPDSHDSPPTRAIDSTDAMQAPALDVDGSQERHARDGLGIYTSRPREV